MRLIKRLLAYLRERWEAENYSPPGWDTPDGRAELRAAIEDTQEFRRLRNGGW
jgi:hypothetical protein